MFRKLSAAVWAHMAVFALPGQATAQDGPGMPRNGFYMEMEMGLAAAPGMAVAGTDNDLGAGCDLIANPDQAEAGSGCMDPPPPPMWVSRAAETTGVLTALTVGYNWGRLRAEGEYFYRTAPHNDIAPLRIGDAGTLRGTGGEIEIAEGGVDDVLARNFFANLRYEFVLDSRFTSYLGIGAGLAHVSLDYFLRAKHNDDPNAIDTFDDPVLKERLSGATTIGNAKLADNLAGVQALAGVDYRVSDPFSLGLKLRWDKARRVRGRKDVGSAPQPRIERCTRLPGPLPCDDE